MKYLAYIIVIGIFLGGTYYFYQEQQPTASGESVTITGKILTGETINRPYCKEGLYIVPDTLVHSTLILREEDSKLFKSPDLIGKVVTIKGNYDSSALKCEALSCGCESYVTVTSVDDTPVQ